MPKLGFLVNPIAGMGGAVGLKGTDGTKTLKEAVRRGARPVSPEKAQDFLLRLKSQGYNRDLIVAPGDMGANLAKVAGLKYETLGRVGKRTTGRDTIRISGLMKRRKVDLVIFCGGDGWEKVCLLWEFPLGSRCSLRCSPSAPPRLRKWRINF